MSREIKFKRAHFFDEGKTKFSHVDEWGIGVKGAGFEEPSSSYDAMYHTDFQFTGLLDKNKVEIYEGDICTRYHLKGVVVYHEERAMFILRDGFNEPLFTEKLGLEVIGNVYQHPELLTKLKH